MDLLRDQSYIICVLYYSPYRALLEAQKVFGIDFDMEEFAQFGEDKTDYLDDEEEEEEVSDNCTCPVQISLRRVLFYPSDVVHDELHRYMVH